MNIDTIRRRLWSANLCDLSRRSGVGLRTLRRLKNQNLGVTYATLERVAAALKRRAP